MNRALLLAALMVAHSGAALAHDMFLVVPDHDVPAHQELTVSLYNGTFESSENTIDRDRMADVSVIAGSGALSHPEPQRWRDEEKTSVLRVAAGPPGTLVVGVSTKPRNIELSAEEFNEYLAHDGILDVLEARREAGILERPATERYSKHVKTILRVGDESSDTWSQRLRYPVEIVPLADPCVLTAGETLEARVLVDGKPVAGQLVYAGYEGYHVHGDDGSHREAVRPVRTRPASFESRSPEAAAGTFA